MTMIMKMTMKKMMTMKIIKNNFKTVCATKSVAVDFIMKKLYYGGISL